MEKSLEMRVVRQINAHLMNGTLNVAMFIKVTRNLIIDQFVTTIFLIES